MKTARTYLIAICTLCALAVTAYNCCFRPRISVSPSKLNFGTAREGKNMHAVVLLRNAGRKTIRIQKVDASCECTTVCANKRKLRPGEIAEVKVDLNTSTLSGHIYRLIAIQTDAPVNKSIFIPISCTVINDGKGR